MHNPYQSMSAAHGMRDRNCSSSMSLYPAENHSLLGEYNSLRGQAMHSRYQSTG